MNNKELLIELGKRIKAGQIKANYFDDSAGFTNLYTGKTQGTYSFWKPELKVNLFDGEITENKIINPIFLTNQSMKKQLNKNENVKQ